MRPSSNSASSVRSVASQRRCFLIDSLLEERQKRLAATVAAKLGANAFNPPEEPKREKDEIGKETMPDLHLEEKGTISGGKSDGTDAEETASEEVLPTFDEDKETNQPNDGTDQTDQRIGPTEIGNDPRSNALLEALAKLVPEAVRQRPEKTEGPVNGVEESAERGEGGEGRETEKGQQAKIAAELLHKFHLFQQQLASPAAVSVPWPFVPPGHSPIPTNFSRLPLFPAPSFSLLSSNPSNNRMPKCFASPSNPCRLTPTSSAKCRIKVPTSEVRNRALGMNSAPAGSNIYPTEWAMPNFFNAGPAGAVLATIGALRVAAATASAQNHGTNGSKNSGNVNETIICNLTSKTVSRGGRRPSATTRQQKRHAPNGSRSTRSSNAKKYRCDICDKTFSRSNTLITHKRIHTGEKPFRCEHCGRAFRQPGNLTRHAYTHTTVKPFVCSECGKAFNRASNLQSHVRVHSAAATGKGGENGGGNGSKQCKRCQANFDTRAELRTHRCQ